MKKEILVTTFDGTTAKKRECRCIKGEYYKKGEQCIHINDRWYRINSGLIVKNWETGVWFLKGEVPHNLVYGIVEYNTEPIFGFFTENYKKNIKVVCPRRSGIHEALSEAILKNTKYVLIDGIYHIEKKQFNDPIENERIYGFPLPYRTNDIPSYIGMLYEAKTYNTKFIEKYYDFVKPLLNYSWGIEIETSSGKLPLKDCINNCLFPLRDGSISGIEYTTPPLRNYNDFYTLYEALNRLKETGHKIDQYCSLHVHVGGVKEEEIAQLYALLIKLEKSVYSMFPKTYIRTSIFKRRDYNNPLQRLSVINNESIFDFLSERTCPYGFYDFHPRDRGNSSKWNVKMRYVWCNLIPFFFSRNRTVEFRIHTPTLNFDKIILWMLFINSILTYIRKNKTEPTSIKNMINSVYDNKVGNILSKYVEIRKRWYTKRDMYGVGEIYLDNRFSIDKL